VASLLLVFLKPGEALQVLRKLVDITSKWLKNFKSKFNWHFTYSENRYYELISDFTISYMSTTVKKDRSLLKHFEKINF